MSDEKKERNDYGEDFIERLEANLYITNRESGVFVDQYEDGSWSVHNPKGCVVHGIANKVEALL